jgi:UDP-glucose 4-epimerase
MGMSKALMEKLFQSKSRLLQEGETIVCGTRYGNVIGSRGSVIPLFVDQLKNNQPMTITHPDMTRFMMSIDEAVELVLFALENGKQGDLFIMKSPAANIKDIAMAVAKGLGKEYLTETIGIRGGEKMYETLMSYEESLNAEDQGKFYRISSNGKSLDYEKYYSKGINTSVADSGYNSNNTRQLNVTEIMDKLIEVGVLFE